MSRRENNNIGEVSYKGWIIVTDALGDVTAYDTDFDWYYFSTLAEAKDFIDTVEGM